MIYEIYVQARKETDVEFINDFKQLGVILGEG